MIVLMSQTSLFISARKIPTTVGAFLGPKQFYADADVAFNYGGAIITSITVLFNLIVCQQYTCIMLHIAHSNGILIHVQLMTKLVIL